MAERPFSQRVGYDLFRMVARLVGVILFRMRCIGRQRIPATGPVLICANHQSFFDPVLVGLAFDRRLNYLARDTLFRFPGFGWIIRYLDAIPIDREGMGLAGMRESLRRIKQGEMILIFPEGTRTTDGSVMPLKPGFCSLARRGNVTLLPVGFDGAYDAWPRSARLPALDTIHLCIGQPLAPSDIRDLSDADLVAEVERRIRECHEQAHRGRMRYINS